MPVDWTAQVDNYCERLAPGLLAEPLNAVTNLAFVLAALWVWPRIRDDRLAVALTLTLAGIGVASGLFHTFATRWSGLADVLSILIFILLYLYGATTRFFRAPAWAGGAAVLLFFPYAAIASWGLTALLGPINGSQPYVAVALLIFAYAAILRHPGLFLGASLLCLSILARSLDQALCPGWPIGTHFLWHVLNAIMLAHMIMVLHRAPSLAEPPPAR